MSAPRPMNATELLQHTRFVRAMARGVLGADDAVEDAMQDTWLAALRGGPSRHDRLRSWLGSVARRRAQDIRRKRAVQQRHERERPSPWGEAPASDELAARAQVGRELVEVLLTLDTPYREVLLLRYYDDLPPRAIAARLDLPVETVRTRIKRGLARVREEMTHKHGGESRPWVGVLATWALPRATASVATLPLLALLFVLLLGGGALLVARPWAPSASSHKGAASQRSNVDGPERTGSPTLAGRNSARADRAQPGVVAAKGSLTGSRFTVTGFVRDEGGHPVVGIPVRYSFDAPRAPGEPRTPEGSRLSEAFTDADGRYVIADLTKGRLWLSLLSEMNFGPSPEVERQLDGDWSHDFVVSGSLLFSGRVEAPGDGEIDVWLDYREERAGGGWNNVGVVRRATLSGADRTFRFIAMRPGIYGLNASGDGLAHDEERVELFANQSHAVISLHRAFNADGRVEVAEGMALDGSSVWARRLPDGEQWHAPCRPDGTFTLENLVAGRYGLFVRNRTETDEGRYVVITERRLELSLEGDRTPIEIRIENDEEIGLDVQLPEGTSAARGHVHVLGGPAGPGHAIEIRVSRTEDGTCRTRAGSMSMPWPAIRNTTASGHVRFGGIPRGTHRLRVELSGYEPVEREIVVSGPMTVSVDVVKSRGRMVKADMGRSLYYRIYARSLDESDIRWREILWMDARILISHTPTPGLFETVLKEGTYEFRVLSREHAETTFGPLTIEEGATPLVLRPKLVRGASLHGRLVAGRDARDTDLLIHVLREGKRGKWDLLEAKKADGFDGEYRVEGLEPGTYRLSGSVTGEPPLAEVEVREADVEQHLRLGAAVHVKELPPRKPRPPEPEEPDDP